MTADTTHMPAEEEKAEWVLNERGTLHTGSAYYVKTKPWVYDQFHPEVVSTVVDMLLSTLPRRELADPVLLSRRMSSLVNANDNNGVMVGNWSGHYPPPAVAPSRWTGSLAVLRKWRESGPVQYGQCFTFAAVGDAHRLKLSACARTSRSRQSQVQTRPVACRIRCSRR